MVRLFALCLAVLAAYAQPAPFTLDQVLGYSFPSFLTAAPAGDKVAWVSNTRGVRNLMVAEAPAWRGRPITNYTTDDGQELQKLAWAPDGAAIAYVRGDDANARGEYPNPALNPQGVEEAVWIVKLDGSAPRKIGEGSSPSISPRGDRLAFLRRGQIWMAPIDGAGAAVQAFKGRGECGPAVWSPVGATFAFTSDRGDHAFIGIFDLESNALRYLDTSTDFDSDPDWSPNGRSVVFLRQRSSGLRAVREPRRAGPPWSIRTASADTGAGRELWRARAGSGSVFRGVTARHQVMWADANRIVFPWEADGWTHLYSISVDGGQPVLLTPGNFEVEDVAPMPGRREIAYSSNQADIDRRHLWRVAVAGGAPVALTSGQGLEYSPEPLTGGALALLQSDAQHPAHPAIRIGNELRAMQPNALPADFPLQHMVAPQQVVFSSADGMEIHGQLFLPPRRAANARAPAVVFFHGGSRRQMLLGWHYMYYYSNAYAMNQYLANTGYVVLSVNYRSGVGYGMNFREALNYGPSGGSEYADVRGAGVYLRTRPEVDPQKIGAWGGSYGGYLTAMALARASDLFKAGVDFHGVHDWARELRIPPGEPDYRIAFEASPLASISTWRSPVLLIQGDDDRDVQFNQTVMLADALRRHNVEVEELILPDEVHDFLLWRSWRDTYAAGAAFLDRKLK